MSIGVCSLFSGIGGFEVGLPFDHSLVCLCDNDPDAQIVLSERFPDVPLLDDVTLVSPDHLSGVDLLLAGFPCQDVSIVGGQRGFAGERTPLVKHVFRLAKAIKPNRMLFENVQSMRFVHQGKVLKYLVSECERLGYAWAYRILDSRGFNLPQRRRRLYFLASRINDPGVDLLGDSGHPIPKEKLSLSAPLGFYWTEGRTGHGLTYDALPPIKAGSAVGIPSPPAVLLPSGEVVLPTLETIEQLQGFESNWTVAAPRRSRWRLVGNAVSPPVSQWILAHRSGASWSQKKTENLVEGSSWPLAAWGNGKGKRLKVNVYEAPSQIRIGRLSNQAFGWTSISSRALSGFVARAVQGQLRYPAGFLERLQDALTATADGYGGGQD